MKAFGFGFVSYVQYKLPSGDRREPVKPGINTRDILENSPGAQGEVDRQQVPQVALDVYKNDR